MQSSKQNSQDTYTHNNNNNNKKQKTKNKNATPQKNVQSWDPKHAHTSARILVSRLVSANTNAREHTHITHIHTHALY
jgi:uncharacterized membrane protein YebE (DUF533 family)